MSLRRIASVCALSCLQALFFVAPAAAFCGFFVSGADDGLKNSASQVVLLRNGNRTVMTMSNNYQGPPQDFAMVVPVPVILKKEQVKTLDRDILRRIDQLSAPRLVEYWEQDPCVPPAQYQGSIGLGSLGGIGRGGGGAGYGSLGVRIEAQFSVGEYEIVILSADQSSGLEKWLRLNNYKIPKGAAEALAPYVRDQMKFFVAKVDIKKIKRDSNGIVVLSPLRFSFDAAELRLPVRLGLLNAQGAQDLIVYILHPVQRFEVANYPNIFIPTNVEVADAVRKNFSSFYAELFDATMQQHKGRAVVTEYSWQTSSCDPCPIPPLTEADMATLGADEGAGSGGGAYPGVNAQTPKVEGPLAADVIRRIALRHINEVRYCYEKELVKAPTVQGNTTVKFDISDDGNVLKSEIQGSTHGNPDLDVCIAGAVRRWQFPKSGKSTVTMPFSMRPSGPRVRFGGGMNTSYVLTRLHTRYDRQALSDDLIFRAADPVLGGRANWDGTLGDQGAKVQTSGPNNFQGRYIIRHYWEGKVACDKPHYGVWSGPPGTGKSVGSPELGIDLANVQRGQVPLKSLVRSAIPSLGISAQPGPKRP